MSKLNSSNISAFVNTGISLLFIRVFAAFFLFYNHGLGKLIKVFSGNFQFADPIGLGPELSLILAAFAEGICTILVAFGWYSRLGALIIMINMAVAVLFYHIPAGDAFGGMELPLLYLVVFTFIFLAGPGKYGVDSNRRSTY